MGRDLEDYKHPPDPAGLMSDLGFQKVRVRGHKITAICPFHADADQEDGFYGLLDRGTYGCGTKQCVPAMDFIELVKKISNLDFKDALRWIGARSGFGDEDVDWRGPKRTRYVAQQRSIQVPSDRITRQTIDDAVAAYWARPPGYWATRPRPFKEDTLQSFEAGLVRRREGNHEHGIVELERAIFPVYSVHEDLVGWTGRCTDEAKVYTGKPEKGRPVIPKWRHFPGQDRNNPERPFFEARDHLFGWSIAQIGMGSTACAILVEGPGDVLSGVEMAFEMDELWFPVGLFGTTLKESQAAVLRDVGVVELWCIIDVDKPDAQGKRAGDQMLASIRREMPFATAWAVSVPDGVKDLGEVSDPAVYRAMIEDRRRLR